jgi:hypothetical protein
LGCGHGDGVLRIDDDLVLPDSAAEPERAQSEEISSPQPQVPVAEVDPVWVGQPFNIADSEASEQPVLRVLRNGIADDDSQRRGQQVRCSVVVSETSARLIELRRCGDVGDLTSWQSGHCVDVPGAVGLATPRHRQQVTPGVQFGWSAVELRKYVADRLIKRGKQSVALGDADNGSENGLRDREDVGRLRPVKPSAIDVLAVDAHQQRGGVVVSGRGHHHVSDPFARSKDRFSIDVHHGPQSRLSDGRALDEVTIEAPSECTGVRTPSFAGVKYPERVATGDWDRRKLSARTVRIRDMAEPCAHVGCSHS